MINLGRLTEGENVICSFQIDTQHFLAYGSILWTLTKPASDRIRSTPETLFLTFSHLLEYRGLIWSALIQVLLMPRLCHVLDGKQKVICWSKWSLKPHSFIQRFKGCYQLRFAYLVILYFSGLKLIISDQCGHFSSWVYFTPLPLLHYLVYGHDDCLQRSMA